MESLKSEVKQLIRCECVLEVNQSVTVSNIHMNKITVTL